MVCSSTTIYYLQTTSLYNIHFKFLYQMTIIIILRQSIYYNLRITALKFSTFANFSLNVYLLIITATKVSNFTSSGQNYITPTA